MSYRARCNKRPCQARRTIKGTYDPNDRLPCDNPGCEGLMYADKRRNRLGAGDGRELCRCDGVQWADTRGSPHAKGSRGCKHWEDCLLDSILSGRKD